MSSNADIARFIVESIDFAEIAALSTLEGLIKVRVFTKGVKRAGGRIGGYKSSSYMKLRRKRSKQVGYVDLEFTGEMRLGLQKGVTEDGNNCLGFVNQRETLKAGANETRYGEVFAPNQNEINQAMAVYARVINQRVGDASRSGR